jgi:hypothetical protein
LFLFSLDLFGSLPADEIEEEFKALKFEDEEIGLFVSLDPFRNEFGQIRVILVRQFDSIIS